MSVTHLVEILLLAYADDIVLFADSYVYMKKIIQALFEYCIINELEVNVNKTKVILFQKGGHGHKKKHAPFLFGNRTIEYVKEYVYLGMCFTQTAVYSKATESVVRKSKTACAATLSLICKLRTNSWEVYCKLFNSLVTSIIMYGAPVYAIRHLEDLEKVHMLFYKRLLNLAQCTPNYAVRLETGERHIAVDVFKVVIAWIIRVLEMTDERYPKICFLRLAALFKANRVKNYKYNWVTLICDTFFKPIGKERFLADPNVSILINEQHNLIEAFARYWYEKDVASARNSSSLIIYPEIELCESTQKYLLLNLDVKELGVVAQVRLLNRYANRIIVKGNQFSVSLTDYCYECAVSNSLVHKITKCPRYIDVRSYLQLSSTEDKSIELFFILENPSYKDIKKLIKLIKHILEDSRL